MALFNQAAIKDIQTNKQLWVDEFNAIRANPTTRLIGKTFLGATKDTNFWTQTVAGSGSVTQGSGVVVLETGATANSTVQYKTNQIAHWIPGQENTFRCVLKVGDTGAANNIRNWGAFLSTDGLFFQLNNTALNIVSRIGSSDTVIAQASWNGNAHGLTNAFTLDTNYHIYEIRYTYSDVHFYIDHNIMHTLEGAGASTFPSGTFDFPVTLQNNNSSGGTADVLMTVGVAFISRVGALETDTAYKNISGAQAGMVLKYGAGRLKDVMVNSIGSSATCVLYDNTAASGTVIATINPLAVGAFYLPYDLTFYNGLTVVTTGATIDVTITYE